MLLTTCCAGCDTPGSAAVPHVPFALVARHHPPAPAGVLVAVPFAGRARDVLLGFKYRNRRAGRRSPGRAARQPPRRRRAARRCGHLGADRASAGGRPRLRPGRAGRPPGRPPARRAVPAAARAGGAAGPQTGSDRAGRLRGPAFRARPRVPARRRARRRRRGHDRCHPAGGDARCGPQAPRRAWPGRRRRHARPPAMAARSRCLNDRAAVATGRDPVDRSDVRPAPLRRSDVAAAAPGRSRRRHRRPGVPPPPPSSRVRRRRRHRGPPPSSSGGRATGPHHRRRRRRWWPPLTAGASSLPGADPGGGTRRRSSSSSSPRSTIRRRRVFAVPRDHDPGHDDPRAQIPDVTSIPDLDDSRADDPGLHQRPGPTGSGRRSRRPTRGAGRSGRRRGAQRAGPGLLRRRHAGLRRAVPRVAEWIRPTRPTATRAPGGSPRTPASPASTPSPSESARSRPRVAGGHPGSR